MLKILLLNNMSLGIIRKNMIYMSYFPPNNFFLFIIWFSILAIMYLEESCVKMILCFYTVLAVSWRNGEDDKESIDRIRDKDCKKIKKPICVLLKLKTG